ncbi:hypothetical protein BDV96DRAFT_568197 [Lophiotrema nucula]|uniref:Uncharacterized protein n=1 Tax=Lophiotrema nucula TaxID=690887 RepID=A0A6A5ZKA2_9PLEO|nr:hypothetical protein BDV96DRAFT_568197 [Lophiotrema nucula]
MERARDVAKMANSRPKSMSDFAALLDASTPLHHPSERMRKKPSISLAAGLIMNHESQNGTPRSLPDTPHLLNGRMGGAGGEGQESLFFAYAQKADYAQSPPYVLTFASASVADQWWTLVQQEYPSSTREGPQLFILKGDDMQEQIQDNPRFYNLRNKWFYTPSDGSTPIIPLQDARGNPITPGARPTSRGSQSVLHSAISEEQDPKPAPFDTAALSASLDKMNAMISENSAQIRALSVAQSEGLQRMQEINESNSTQIKALADGQAKLQNLMGENASHYVALSNSSFANQEQVKGVLQTNAQQIKALADGQTKLASTCAGMMKTIEHLGQTVGKVSENVSQLHLRSNVGSDAGSLPFSQIGNKIAPPPRKLNRKIKGVWYEYDTTSTGPSPMSSPRRSMVMAPETPPKSPASSTRTWNM